MISDLVQESFFILTVFGAFFWFALYRGRQALINLIFGLYLGLFFTQNAPVAIINDDGTLESALLSVTLFLVVTVAATLIIAKVMPLPFQEKKFESFGKKLFLVIAATILVMLYSFQVLPIDSLVTINSPLSTMWSHESTFFWWLLAPFILLYFHR